jgi:hypothetical protein
MIEHVGDDSALMDRFGDLLPPGGLLYATVPAHAWLWSGSDLGAGHFRRYSPAGIRALLASRLELVYCTHFFSALTLPVLLARALPFKLGFRRSLADSEAAHGASGAARPAARALARLLAWEAGSIAAGKILPLGTSLLFVARKGAAKTGKPDRPC